MSASEQASDSLEEAPPARRRDGRRAALDAILSRQSVSAKRLVAPGPGEDDVRLMIATAMTAPDHGSLRPCRFIRIADAARDRLADLFVEIRRGREPDATPAELARDREKALSGPCLIAVVGRIRHDHPKVPESEQYASIGAAVMAVLVAAHLSGYGAIMLSGDRVRDPLLREALAIGEAEELVGFITIGTVGGSPPAKQRPAPDDYLSTWPETTTAPQR